jgi:hypothetical protein
MLFMFGAISFMVAGVAATIGAVRFPERQALLERCAGGFLLGGLALLGFALPVL